MAIDLSRFRASIDGRDVSPAIAPTLERIAVTDQAGAISDSASLAFDDADGAIALPRRGALLRIDLVDRKGLAQVFEGVVDEVRSSGSRGSGRGLVVSAKGADMRGPLKELRERHWDDATLRDALTDAALAAGLQSAHVDPAIGAIRRAYVAQQGESFLAFGQRLARETGGTFKVVGGRALLVKRGAATSASGLPLAPIVAEWGVNLVAWDIAPDLGRARYAAAAVRRYDVASASWSEAREATASGKGTATRRARYAAADGDQASTRARADADEADRDAGAGSVTIDGDTAARAEAPCVVKGARVGVDGEYRIDQVEHTLDRAGYLCSLQLKHPQAGVGEDARRRASP